MRKLLRWFLAIVLGTVGTILLFLVIVTVFAIPVELTRFKTPLEEMAAQLLGRPVQIEGSIVVATSLKPAFTLKGLRIQNPENFEQKDFLLMDEVRLQLSLLPLLKKKVHIPLFKVHGLVVTLEENQQGEVNWIFGSQKVDTSVDTAAESAADSGTAVEQAKGIDFKKMPKGEKLANDSIVVKKLDLQKIEVAYYAADKEQPSLFILSKCDGVMDVGQPMSLDIVGKAEEFPYSVNVSLASLEEFIKDNETWVDINLEIAKTSFTLSGKLDLKTAARSLTLGASVGGENLSDLNDLLKIDLPPFSPYKLITQLQLKEHVAELREMKIETGLSSLIGSARIERAGENINAKIDLHSPLIQIDDFVFDDWSWQGSEEAGEEEEVVDSSEDLAASETADEEQQDENTKLIDPELLQRFDCSLSVAADKVESGKDFLGSGDLKATLKDGRIDIDPLSVQVPGGGIDLAASLKPGDTESEGSLKVLIENFDIGILVRRRQPDSDMGGKVNLNIDLNSTATSVPELMTSGDGYFDFSGNLINFKAGIIDLWAVNLISAIVSTGKEKSSQINCAVGRWSTDNGLLTSDTFFIDTSKIRICAEGSVNLKEESLNIRVAPRAKRAEFFSLATPVKLQGSFSDLNVKLAGGGVLGTAVGVVISPITTPLQRLFNHKIPQDGSDVCGMELGAANRDEIIVPGCK